MTTRKMSFGECTRRCKIRKVDAASRQEPRSSQSVLKSQLDILTHGTFSDVTFIVGVRKERIPCHQLKTRSSVFEVMFSERWSQESKEVTLGDVDPEIFRKFIEFLYTDALEANACEAIELLQLADMYDVQILGSRCEKLLEYKINFDDSIAVFQTARNYAKIQLMDKIGDMWAESLAKLQCLPTFTELDKETLIYILKRNDLKMKEVDIFRLTLQWAKNQIGAFVDDYLADILPLIRFPTMTLNEFATAVVPTNVLSPSTVIRLFTYLGSDDEAKDSMADTMGYSVQQRQPKISTAYVEIYREDPIENFETTAPRRFLKVKESMQYQLQSLYTPKQTYNIGLNAISVYCPLKAATSLPSARASTSFRAFKICFKSRCFRDNDYDLRSSDFYQELLILDNVLLPEGKITDIKLSTVVRLRKYKIFCITIEEEPGNRGVHGYHAQKSYKHPKYGVAVSVGKNGQVILSCVRNQLQDFEHDISDQLHPSQTNHQVGFRGIVICLLKLFTVI